MKRRNAEIGKMRRPLKRTKIPDGMYGNGLLYLKFVMVWVTVVLADYMLEFRFEFLWPIWMMMRSLYDSYKYQGLAFSVFFICIALTSDMICFFFIPLQYIFFAASTYVWVQYVWYSYKGICIPTVAICCVLLYVEGALKSERTNPELCRPLAAHCVGYPVVTLGFGVKSLVGERLRLRRQRQVRAENDFYFQLMRAALPHSALEQNQTQAAKESSSNVNKSSEETTETKSSNGSLRRRTAKEHKPDPLSKQDKLDKQEKHTAAPQPVPVPREKDKDKEKEKESDKEKEREREKEREKEKEKVKEKEKEKKSVEFNLAAQPSAMCNGHPPLAHADDERTCRSSAKSLKCEKKDGSTVKEERKKIKNKDTDSHKSSELTKELSIVKDKEVESTKDSVKCSKECYRYKEKAKEREKEAKEKEKEFEREREKERESRAARERWWGAEVRRLTAELSAARDSEQEARRSLAAARRRQPVASKHSADSGGDRRTRNDQRGKTAQNRTDSSTCSAASCRAAARALEAETAALRRDLLRARDRAALLQARPAPPPPPAPPALHERAAHLERALSAETRVKLDLLSALGDAKRQLTIQDGVITKQDKEIEELKAQMFAVLPEEFVTDNTRGGNPPNVTNAATYSPVNNSTTYSPVNNSTTYSPVNNSTTYSPVNNVNSYVNVSNYPPVCSYAPGNNANSIYPTANNVTGYPNNANGNKNPHQYANSYPGVKLLDPNASAYTPKQLCSDA